MKTNPNIFFKITKVDEDKRLVSGIATAELPDKTNEVCDYESTKPYYEKWSEGFRKATDGKSLGNLRAMHDNIAAGKIIALDMDDAAKTISITAKVVDDDCWNKVKEGVFTGFSQGGEYIRKWKDGAVMRYTADPSEVSLVDNPCLGEAIFEVIKADGTHEMRKFIAKKESNMPKQQWTTTDGKTFDKKSEAVEHQGKIDADEFVKTVTGRVTETLNDINKTLDDKDAPIAKTTKEHFAKIKTLLAKSPAWDSAAAIDALISIQFLISCEEWEEGEEDAEQMADLQTACERLKSFISSEIMEGMGEEDSAMAMAARGGLTKAEHSEHVHEIHKASANIMTRCMKAMSAEDPEEAEKFMKAAGAESMDHLHMIHKKAQGICTRCMKMGSDFKPEGTDDENDTENHEKIFKSIMSKAVNERDALTKAVEPLKTMVEDLQKRLAHLEAQPAPRKGVAMIVAKNHLENSQGHEPDNTGQAVETPSMSTAGMSPGDIRSMFAR